MISYLSWWTFWIYICNVQRTQSVRIFGGLVKPPITMFTRYEPKVISKTCMLTPDLGPCRSKIRMWYFDPAQNNCSRFDWGGCQGNGNRFDSFDQCWGSCMNKPGDNKRRPRYCSLGFDYGFCFGAIQRWYYDRLWKVCKNTIYSGCGGNKNNFYSLEQCESICRFGRGGMTTQRAKVGARHKVLVINPWNMTPKRGSNQGNIVGRMPNTSNVDTNNIYMTSPSSHVPLNK